jgi:hypothetical protein
MSHARGDGRGLPRNARGANVGALLLSAAFCYTRVQAKAFHHMYAPSTNNIAANA